MRSLPLTNETNGRFGLLMDFAISGLFNIVFICFGGQVWSLTYLLPVEFSQSKIGVKKCVTDAQSRFASAVLNSVLGPPRLAQHTWQCPCISVVLEATHEASRGPSKGAVSAQKALQGSEMETRELLGGIRENSVSHPGKSMIFFTKRKQKKIELVARPGTEVVGWEFWSTAS